MNKALFGRYWPADGFIQSLDARAKITMCIILIASILLADNWPAMGFCALAIIAMFGLSKIPPTEALRSILPLAFIIVISALFNMFFVDDGNVLVDLGWLKVTTAGLELAAFMSVRLALLLLLGSLLTMTTTTFDITFAIEDMLAPLTRIKAPVHEFAFVVSTALHFLPQMFDEFDDIRMAQEARGAKLVTTPLKGIRGLASIMTPLFAGVFRHADTLTLAMEARCYVPGAQRTRLRPMHMRTRDYVFMCAALGVFAASILLGFL